jgi:hypothetical protein
MSSILKPRSLKASPPNAQFSSRIILISFIKKLRFKCTYKHIYHADLSQLASAEGRETSIGRVASHG